MAYNIMVGVVIVSFVLVMVVFPLVTYLWYKAGKLRLLTFVAFAPFVILIPALACAGLLWAAIPEPWMLTQVTKMLGIVVLAAVVASITGVLTVKQGMSRGRIK